MSGTILTTSEIRKPGVVPTLGVVVAVTNEYSNGTAIRVTGYPFQYPSSTRVFKYPLSPSTTCDGLTACY